MRRRTVVIALVIACVLVVVVGVFAATRLVAGPGSLTGRSWTLSQLSLGGQDQPLLPSHPITLRFQAQNRQVLGSSGCNSYGGSYLALGDTLHISDLQMTLMACVDPDSSQPDTDVMGQESKYVEALGQIDSYRFDGGFLTLSGNGGQTKLTFRPGSE